MEGDQMNLAGSGPADGVRLPAMHQRRELHRAGGNVAFLSGNTCYWRIRFENGGDTIVCYKDAQMDPLTFSDPPLTTTLWADSPVPDSERKLTGVSGAFLYDPEKAEDWRTYIVTEETHWVFADTGLRNGNAFGTYTRADGQIRTVLGPATDTTGPETPGSFNVLALMNDGSKPGNNQTASMVLSEGQPGRGTVFSAATIDWVLGLTSGGETPIDQITRNVLERASSAAGPRARHRLRTAKLSCRYAGEGHRR
jgi:hypothetical protein